MVPLAVISWAQSFERFYCEFDTMHPRAKQNSSLIMFLLTSAHQDVIPSQHLKQMPSQVVRSNYPMRYERQLGFDKIESIFVTS